MERFPKEELGKVGDQFQNTRRRVCRYLLEWCRRIVVLLRDVVVSHAKVQRRRVNLRDGLIEPTLRIKQGQRAEDKSKHKRRRVGKD
jgi:hypothetical protein